MDKASPRTPTTIDDYIATASAEAQPILEEIRRIVRGAAPGAQELISYRMPAFRLHRIFVYFAAFKNHVGLYPPVSGDAKLEKALRPYAGPKGNLKFPLDQSYLPAFNAGGQNILEQFPIVGSRDGSEGSKR